MDQHIESLKHGTTKFMNNKELARLEADFASMDITNSHVIHSKSKIYHKYLSRQKEIYFYLYKLETIVMIKGQYLVMLYHQIYIP